MYSKSSKSKYNCYDLNQIDKFTEKGNKRPSTISFQPLLKVRGEGESLASERNWFQNSGPRNEIDVLKRTTRNSASLFLSLIVLREEFFTNSSDRYSDEQLLFELLHYGSLRAARLKVEAARRLHYGRCFT